ncbi:MAG: hypothetical protein CSA84_00115 [Actinomycetales bacterium]|nr:MAG: hypothetical protein CSA84_00115 [Actinomycetales bacterium]
MQISESFVYPAPVELVFEMMTDEDFQSQVCVATFAISHSVEITFDGPDRAAVHTSREMPTKGFPDYAKRIVGMSITANQTIVYDDPDEEGVRFGNMRISMGHAPVGLIGSIVLTPTAEDHTKVEVLGELTSSIPLIGNKIVEAAAPLVTAGIHKERETGLAWLTRV